MQPVRREPGTSVNVNTPVAEPGFHNPSPMVWIIVHTNEAVVVVEGVEMVALVDTRSKISALTEWFCLEFGFRILPLRGLLHLKGTGGVPIPYNRYIEANLTIPSLRRYNEDVLFLVVLNNKYGERVLVQIGTQLIDHLVVTMTKKNCNRLGISGNRYTSAL